jgi:uncharacterized protein (TIGR00251 family)
MKLEIHITPNASRDVITGWTDSGVLNVKIQSPPVEGAANKGLLRFIAKQTGVSKSRVRIIRGEKSRNKLLEIDGDDADILSALKGER